MVDTDAVRRSYDELAETYDAQRSTTGPSMDVLETFLNELPSPTRILDAGCGGGEPVLSRLSESMDAVGLDVSRRQLSMASDRAPAAACVQGDMARLPFADDAFDAVVAYWSLIHVPMANHRTVLDEFARVVRPNGRVLVCEGTNEWVGRNPDWLDTGVEMEWNIAGAARTREQLRDAGFAVTDAWRVSDSVDDDADDGIERVDRCGAGNQSESVDRNGAENERERTEVEDERNGEGEDVLPWTIFAARLER